MARACREALVLRLAAGLVVVGLSLLAFSASARAATIPVANTNDAGAGSLRAAITFANASAGPDVVDATGVSGTINLLTALPPLSQDIEIRGPGAAALTVRRDAGAIGFGIFGIDPGVTTEISGLRIASGLVGGMTIGGAGIANDGTLTLRDSVVTANVSSAVGSDGGGILNDGTLTVLRSTVSGNSAETGGGISNRGNAVLTVRNSVVSGNTATETSPGGRGGAGIRNHIGGRTTVVNSTVSGNTTGGRGAGIYTEGDTGQTTRVTIRNSTVAANTGAGANLWSDDDMFGITLRSTIVSNPLGDNRNCSTGGGGLITSLGFNLASDATCNLNQPTDRPNINPLLGPLANNGGPTRTMALPLASPAVDKGIRNGLTADQRGLTRPVDIPDIPNAPGGDGTDIGAFEVQTPPPPPQPPSNEFSFGKLKRNKKRGTAKLTIEVAEGPGELELAKTKKVKADEEVVEGEGATEERLAIKPKGKAKRKLRERGKAKVKAEVTYTPTGGEPNAQSKKLKLKRRR